MKYKLSTEVFFNKIGMAKNVKIKVKKAKGSKSQNFWKRRSFHFPFPGGKPVTFPILKKWEFFFLQMRMKRVICNGIDEILCSGYSARLFYFISPGQGAMPCAKSVRNFLHPLQTCCIQNLISKFLPVILTQTRKVRCNTSCYEYIFCHLLF